MSSIAEMEDIAEKAAEKTVEKLFLRLGVKVSDPIEMQKDFAFIRGLRESTEMVKRRGLTAAVTTIVVGVMGLIYAHFAHKF